MFALTLVRAFFYLGGVYVYAFIGDEEGIKLKRMVKG